MSIPQVYFGAADRQMEGFLSPDSFERHFMWAMLFQGDLVVPDIYFYISHSVREAVLGKRLPHLALALRNGHLVPTFRSNVNGSFLENLKEIKDQGIQGILPQAEEIAAALQAAAGGSSRYTHTVWPKALLSEALEQLIARSLGGEPRSATADLANTWTATAALRASVIPDAVSRSGPGGLRRGEIYNAVARYYGLPTTRIDDVRTIISQIRDEAEQKAAQRFIKWVNYCYHYNQGQMFRVKPSLVEMDLIDIEFSGLLRDTGQGDDQVEALCTTLILPSVNQLLTVDPTRLLRLRESEKATAYFERLAAWQAAPSDMTADGLLDALASYTDKITETYVSYGRHVFRPREILRATIPTHSTRADFLLRRVVAVAETLLLPIGVIGFVADTVTGAYGLLPERIQDVLKWTLKVKETVKFEAEPDRRLIHMRSGEESTADSVYE